MTTIPQRLREIARSVHELEYGQPNALADSLLSIASEIEAPAADAVQVVAYHKPRTVGCVRIDGDEVHLYPLIRDREQAGLRDGEWLVSERDHLATVAALQARINALEARQAPAIGTIYPPLQVATAYGMVELAKRESMLDASAGYKPCREYGPNGDPPSLPQPDSSKERT